MFDNATSMKPHWAVATYTAETLVRKVASLDDDGIDYVFTTGQFHKFQKANGDNAGPIIRNAMIANPPDQFKTSMDNTLSVIFDKYTREGQRKQTTLLIFTDGVWAADRDPVRVQKLIQEFARQSIRRYQKRWFSIQFISFGRDPDGIYHLQYLDDRMEIDYGVA